MRNSPLGDMKSCRLSRVLWRRCRRGAAFDFVEMEMAEIDERSSRARLMPRTTQPLKGHQDDEGKSRYPVTCPFVIVVPSFCRSEDVRCASGAEIMKAILAPGVIQEPVNGRCHDVYIMTSVAQQRFAEAAGAGG